SRSAARAASQASRPAMARRWSNRRRAATHPRRRPRRAQPRAPPGCRARRRGSPALVRALLDPASGKLGEVAAHRPIRGGRGLEVVLGPPEREVAVPGRPGGASVAVERHSGAARVDEVAAVRTRATELEMAVAEDDRPVADAGKQALLPLLRLRSEAVVVSERRAVHVEDAVELGLRRQRVQPLHLVVRELAVESLVRLAHLRPVLGWLESPALAG